jgi:hypothetical protein
VSLCDAGSKGQYRCVIVGSTLLWESAVVLNGVMVTVLAIGPKIRGFKPGQG